MAAPVVADNILRLNRGAPLLSEVNLKAGYRTPIRFRNLLASFCRHVDARRFKEWSETFTKDGVFGTRSGRAAIYESILGGELARHPELQRKHAVVSAVIDVSGDSATSASNLVMYDRWSDSPWTIRLGRYTDRLDRRDGRWLFTERRQEWIDLSAGD